MNYCVINGRRSTGVKGLLISSLPPISKPMMRTAVEEIDGRDGDIVTKLGFSAYDKTMQIGLFGDYDVNQVIEFFNSQGIVIFSNEPDKYYRFQIVQQIDFERLLRFKTASVVFHVQPFKYSAVEEVYEAAQLPATSMSVNLFNNGNIYSRPILTITATGTVTVKVDDVSILSIDMSATSGSITIDTEKMNAYEGTTLRNRAVTGDYKNLVLHPGMNDIDINGSVTSISIKNYSRWI